MKKRSVCPSWMFFCCRYSSCSFFHRKLPQEKPERSFCTWMGWAFHLQSAQDQALTDPDTCYWEISPPSERYRTIPGRGHWAAIVLRKKLPAEAFEDSWHTEKTMCYSCYSTKKFGYLWPIKKKSHLIIVYFDWWVLWLCSIFCEKLKDESSTYNTCKSCMITHFFIFNI